MIPYGRQDINQDDIDAVIDVLQSNFLTQGPAVPAFEKAVADKDQEICGAVIFLTSGEADYVSGQNIVVDGGYAAW